MARDMTLFVDDDGKAYYACASEENATLQIHELSDDFQGFTGRYVRVLRGDYHEAPAFFKKMASIGYLPPIALVGRPIPGEYRFATQCWENGRKSAIPAVGKGRKSRAPALIPPSPTQLFCRRAPQLYLCKARKTPLFMSATDGYPRTPSTADTYSCLLSGRMGLPS